MNDFYNRIDSSTVDRSSTKVLVGDVHADVVSQAMLKNATVVCNFLQRLASECDVWLTMIYVTRNPLDNIADRFRRTKRRKTEKMLNDVFVDHWCVRTAWHRVYALCQTHMISLTGSTKRWRSTRCANVPTSIRNKRCTSTSTRCAPTPPTRCARGTTVYYRLHRLTAQQVRFFRARRLPAIVARQRR